MQHGRRCAPSGAVLDDLEGPLLMPGVCFDHCRLLPIGLRLELNFGTAMYRTEVIATSNEVMRI